MEHYWYKNAIFYSLDVESYYDSNGDGIGDFKGLIQKLDSIAGLGVNCIWLLPFYPSPNRDNGYDVMDYYNVDPRLGTLGDFAAFLDKAEQLGLRVIIDLVVNHTSIEHPWFQEARKDKASPYRDYYVWSDKPQEYAEEHLMFQGEEDSVWSYDRKARQYYLHRFYKWQPDLNTLNPTVREEIFQIIRFWLRLGVHGFRIDATQALVEPYGLKDADKKNMLSFINELRTFVQTQKKDALLLAEVNAGPKEMMTYLQGQERMHMLFNFYINQHLFLSLAEENRTAILKALQALPRIDPASQWLNFLRHHDELNLRLLAAKKQQNVFDVFAPDENMRIYGFGIRRRIAPMLNGDREQLKLAYSLLFSMPGTQMIRYGDEIGMGEDLSLEGRTSVRTPMQWSPSKNGGFSSAPQKKLVHPMISNGKFSYHDVNVLAAQQQPGSLLNWLERLITTRRNCAEIGDGEIFIVPFKNEKILIHGFQSNGSKLIFLHNFSGEALQIPRNDIETKKMYDVFGEKTPEEDGSIFIGAYGYRWLRTE